MQAEKILKNSGQFSQRKWMKKNIGNFFRNNGIIIACYEFSDLTETQSR